MGKLSQNEVEKRKPFLITDNNYDTINDRIKIGNVIENDVEEDTENETEVLL